MNAPFPPSGYCQSCGGHIPTPPRGQAFPSLCAGCANKAEESSRLEALYAKKVSDAEAALRAQEAQVRTQALLDSAEAEGRAAAEEARLAWMERRLDSLERIAEVPVGCVVATCTCGAELQLKDGAGTLEEHGWAALPCEAGLRCYRCQHGFARAMEQQERDDRLIYGPELDPEDGWDDEWDDAENFEVASDASVIRKLRDVIDAHEELWHQLDEHLAHSSSIDPVYSIWSAANDIIKEAASQ